MNTVCPGIVRTSLARDYQARGSLGMRLAVGAFQGLFGKSAADGARSYLAAVTTKEEQHVSNTILQFYKPAVPLFFLPRHTMLSMTASGPFDTSQVQFL
jgi:hypothetical protein